MTKLVIQIPCLNEAATENGGVKLDHRAAV